jgi:uncharacterized protein YcaQ
VGFAFFPPIRRQWGHELNAETPSALAAELRRLASWLGLGEVTVGSRGDLAAAVAAELRS